MPDKTQPKDPGIEASRVEREVAQERIEAQATSRKPGYNSNGDPELYPSEQEGLMRQYNLTSPEAAQLWQRTVIGGENADSVANELRTGRVWYRQHYEVIRNPVENALTAVQVAAAKQEEEARLAKEREQEQAGAVKTPTSDRTQPEAGPWGPYADYTPVTVPAEEVAHNTGLPLSKVEEVRGNEAKKTGGRNG